MNYNGDDRRSAKAVAAVEPSKDLLTIAEVQTRVRIKRSTIYHQIKQGTFPKQIKVLRLSYWLEPEITEYLRLRVERRGDDGNGADDDDADAS